MRRSRASTRQRGSITRRTLLLASLLAPLAPLQASAQPAAPRVSDAWARPTVAGQAAGGGFLQITGGAVPDRLLAAHSEAAGRVELHSMSMDGHVMRMRQVDAIEVPAGKTVKLQPGGLHLMLMELKQPLQAGSRIALTLRFERAGEQRVEMAVTMTPPGGAGAAHGGGHKH